MLKAITLFQPWATLMAGGRKCIETRSFTTSHRGLLAIHAAKALTNEMYSAFLEPNIRSAMHALGYDDFGRLNHGDIIGLVKIYDVHASDDMYVPTQESYFGNFTPGRFGWLTKEPVSLLVPIPCRGYQRIWTVPPEIEARVRKQLP